jgi:hypothetical protein
MGSARLPSHWGSIDRTQILVVGLALAVGFDRVGAGVLLFGPDPLEVLDVVSRLDVSRIRPPLWLNTGINTGRSLGFGRKAATGSCGRANLEMLNLGG